MTEPGDVPNIDLLLNEDDSEGEKIVEDLLKIIDSDESTSSSRSANTGFNWRRYYKMHEIEEWMDGILTAYPDITESIVIGKSYEQRDIRGIKISHNCDKPGIFIESNIHAREWITSATATWLINQLLTSENDAIRDLAQNYVWYIIPVVNVDGFVYSHETDRNWRKTRKPVKRNNCIGADPNRNFGYQWMAGAGQWGGPSDDPCADAFAGTEAFSESETAALASYLTSIQDKIKIYLSFHSYGQRLFSPYAYTGAKFPTNYNDLLTIGNAFVKAVAALPDKTTYVTGSQGSLLYASGGASIDWVYAILGIQVSYIIEFRDLGLTGFDLPPEQILPNCEELMAGMIALVNKAKDLKYV